MKWILLAALVLLAPAQMAMARGRGNRTGAQGSEVARHHPRRHQVYKKAQQQRQHIKAGVKTGKLSQRQARRPGAHDRGIKRQEHLQRLSKPRTLGRTK